MSDLQTVEGDMTPQQIIEDVLTVVPDNSLCTTKDLAGRIIATLVAKGYVIAQKKDERSRARWFWPEYDGQDTYPDVSSILENYDPGEVVEIKGATVVAHFYAVHLPPTEDEDNTWRSYIYEFTTKDEADAAVAKWESERDG